MLQQHGSNQRNDGNLLRSVLCKMIKDAQGIPVYSSGIPRLRRLKWIMSFALLHSLT